MKLTVRETKAPEEEVEAEAVAGDSAVGEDLEMEASEEAGAEAASYPEEEGEAEDLQASEELREEDLSEEEEEAGEISREVEEVRAAPNLNHQNEHHFFHYHQLASIFQHMLK